MRSSLNNLDASIPALPRAFCRANVDQLIRYYVSDSSNTIINMLATSEGKLWNMHRREYTISIWSLNKMS